MGQQYKTIFQSASLVGIHAEAENAAIFYSSNEDLPVWIGLSKVG